MGGPKTVPQYEVVWTQRRKFFETVANKSSFEFKQMYLKAALLFKRMLSETKQKFFWARWRDEILSRQRAQKTFAWLHTAFETDIFLLPSLSRGTNFWHIFSKGWKFFTTVTKHFYTFLPLIPSDKFWRNFCIFPWRNCGRKIRDFKEWSKIRVSCFFWQIKVGKN